MPRVKTKVNKSAAIRDMLRDDPSATPKQIAEALALKGIKVTPTLISQVKYNPLKRGEPASKVLATTNGTPSDSAIDLHTVVGQLQTAKTFVSEVGGVDKARELLTEYARLA